MNFTEKEKNIIELILRKKEQLEKENDPIAILDFKDLNKILIQEELEIIKKIMEANPKNYGFNGPFLGLLPVPGDLVKLENQKFKRGQQENIISTQFVPEKVCAAFAEMNEKMYQQIGKKVLIESGYRSPAYQLLTFLYYFRQHDWDFSTAARRVALPGYSEHGYPPRQALDFITIEGIPSDEDPQEFAKTEEYKWLLNNAKNFSFYLSYPENNSFGVIFEPWHWSFRSD